MNFIARNRRSWYLGLIFLFVLVPLLVAVALWLGFRTSYVANSISLKASQLTGQYVRIGEVVPHGFGGISLRDVRVEGGPAGQPLLRAKEITWNREGRKEVLIIEGELLFDTGADSALVAVIERLKQGRDEQSTDDKAFSAIAFDNCRVVIPGATEERLTVAIEKARLNFAAAALEFDINAARINSPAFRGHLRLRFDCERGAEGGLSDIVMDGRDMPAVEISPRDGGGRISWAEMLSFDLAPTFGEGGNCDAVALQKIELNFNQLFKLLPERAATVQRFLGMAEPHLSGELRYQRRDQQRVQGSLYCVDGEGGARGFGADISIDERGQLTITHAGREAMTLLRKQIIFPKASTTVVTAHVADGGLLGKVERARFTVEVPSIDLTVNDIETVRAFDFSAQTSAEMGK